MLEEFLFVEKYRPVRVKDCVLPEGLKKTFQQFVDQGNIPNLILSGTSGVGKTAIAVAMCKELDCDYLIKNCQLEVNIDALRNDLQNFASSVSFTGGRKYIILDEADYLSPANAQPALRNFMETFSKNCGFILTCNYKSRIIEPLHSRCSNIEFKIEQDEKPKIASDFFRRVIYILKAENITYNPKVIAGVITKFFPDFRKTINELQRYSSLGNIDTGILHNSNIELNELINSVKLKDFQGIRKWVQDNSSDEPSHIFRKIYDTSFELLIPQRVPFLITLIGKYQYQAAFALDQEINLMSFFAEVMLENIYNESV